MTVSHERLKTIEHKTWIFTKRFLITVAALTIVFFVLLIAMSAAP